MLRIKNNQPSMVFKLNYEEQLILVPDPYEFPPLQGFAQALENLKKKNSREETTMLSQIVYIDCYHPKQRLGQLSLHRFPVKERQEQLFAGEEVFPFSGLSHHAALMRKPELVVKYVQGPPLPSSQIEYAGVFIVDEQIDHVFAKAEPPTHDDWAFQSLEDPREKTFVRVAIKRIQEALQNFTLSPTTDSKGEGTLPLGAFADRLGDLLLGAESSGAARQPFDGRHNDSNKNREADKSKEKVGVGISTAHPGEQTGQPSPPSRSTQKARINLLHTPTPGFVGDIPALLTEFVVEHAAGSQATKVSVEANAVLDGEELEKDPPIGGQVPHILLWIAPDKHNLPGKPEITIPTSSTGTWGVVVSIPDDSIISVNLTASEVV